MPDSLRHGIHASVPCGRVMRISTRTLEHGCACRQEFHLWHMHRTQHIQDRVEASHHTVPCIHQAHDPRGKCRVCLAVWAKGMYKKGADHSTGILHRHLPYIWHGGHRGKVQVRGLHAARQLIPLQHCLDSADQHILFIRHRSILHSFVRL